MSDRAGSPNSQYSSRNRFSVIFLSKPGHAEDTDISFLDDLVPSFIVVITGLITG